MKSLIVLTTLLLSLSACSIFNKGLDIIYAPDQDLLELLETNKTYYEDLTIKVNRDSEIDNNLLRLSKENHNFTVNGIANRIRNGEHATLANYRIDLDNNFNLLNELDRRVNPDNAGARNISTELTRKFLLDIADNLARKHYSKEFIKTYKIE